MQIPLFSISSYFQFALMPRRHILSVSPESMQSANKGGTSNSRREGHLTVSPLYSPGTPQHSRQCSKVWRVSWTIKNSLPLC